MSPNWSVCWWCPRGLCRSLPSVLSQARPWRSQCQHLLYSKGRIEVLAVADESIRRCLLNLARGNNMIFSGQKVVKACYYEKDMLTAKNSSAAVIFDI